MNDWGLSASGFKPKTFHAIKEEIETALRNTVDQSLRFTPDTIAGQLTGIIASQTRQVWEMASGLYASLDSHTASGRALDTLCALTGTYRKQAAPSRAVLKAKLAAGTVLPKGIIVADETHANARFRTTKEIKNETSEERHFLIEVLAEEDGPTYVEADKLTKIVTPHSGFLAANNPEDAIPGCFTEPDTDLRLRRIKELGTPGSSTIGAMTARLMDVRAVEAVHIEEQEHGFCAYVLGGDDKEIADTIWQHKALGVHTYGTMTCEVKASNGQTKVIRFSRPKTIEIALHLNLKVKNHIDDHELDALKKTIITYCKERFSFGHLPYPAQIYPVLFQQQKIIDVMSIQFRCDGDELPNMVSPHEVLSISENNIHIEQILEARS
jgi:uncharacterized phage protein gp47/JayE